MAAGGLFFWGGGKQQPPGGNKTEPPDAALTAPGLIRSPCGGAVVSSWSAGSGNSGVRSQASSAMRLLFCQSSRHPDALANWETDPDCQGGTSV